MPTKSIRLLQITDPHLHAHRDAMMRGLNTFDTFKAIIERVRDGERRPDAVIATGDLVQDETRQGYDRFRKLLATLNAPVHCLPGNHDSPRIMAELLDEPPFQFCGHAVYGNWCLILLNTAMRWNDSGELDDDQLARLDRTLAAHSDKHVLIGMHHHPLPMGSPWLDGIGLRNAQQFLDAIDRHPHVRCVTWGHVHQESERERNGVKMLSTPSTGSQFLPRSEVFAVDSRPPGYRWIDLLPDGSIATEVVWL